MKGAGYYDRHSTAQRSSIQAFQDRIEVPIPFFVDFRQNGDAEAYAGAFTGFLRAIFEPVVRAAIKQPQREAVTVESLYERVTPACWPSLTATCGAIPWWPSC
jgi:hypothetical protein